MKLTFESAKLVGPATSSHKSQIVRKDTVALLTTKLLKGDSSTLNTNTLLDDFQKHYHQSDDSSTLVRIKGALRSSILQEDLESFILLVIENNYLYAALKGEVQLYLLRKARLIKILEGKTKTNFVSGQLQDDDTLFGATNILLKNHSLGVIKAALAHSVIAETTDLLAPLVNATSGAASIIIKVSNESTKKLMDTNNVQKISPLAEMGKKFKIIVVNLIDKLLQFLPQEKVYINDRDISYKARKSAHRAAAIGILLIIVLGVSVFFGIKKVRMNAREAQFREAVKVMEDKISEAQGLQSLNPARARALILEAQKDVEKIIADFPDQNTQNLVSDIDNQVRGIGGLYQVEPEVFLDLSLVSSGMQADIITQSVGRILVLDKSTDKIVSVNISNKKTQVIANPADLGAASDITAYVNRNFALTDEGIIELVNPRRKVLEKDWENARILAYTGNMYVLDTSRRQILRFSGQDQTFGNKSEWLTPDAFPDGNIKAWAIDGSIWILSGNELYRYISGRQDSFYLQSATGSTFDYFYTDEESENLYLLDSASSRIIVFDKKGVFKVEYQTNLLSEAKGFIVSEAEKKLVFITGSKLYSMPLQHLGSN